MGCRLCSAHTKFVALCIPGEVWIPHLHELFLAPCQLGLQLLAARRRRLRRGAQREERVRGGASARGLLTSGTFSLSGIARRLAPPMGIVPVTPQPLSFLEDLTARGSSCRSSWLPRQPHEHY